MEKKLNRDAAKRRAREVGAPFDRAEHQRELIRLGLNDLHSLCFLIVLALVEQSGKTSGLIGR